MSPLSLIIFLMTNKTHTKKAVFTIGGPASGKSTTLRTLFPGTPVLDCDSIKESHPDYDPKNPQALHVWSREQLTARFFSTVEGDDSFAYDGTGCNVARMHEWMTTARDRGFEIVLLYVTCSAAEAVRRNASRERVVPAEIVLTKHAVVDECFTSIKDHADDVIVFDTEKTPKKAAA